MKIRWVWIALFCSAGCASPETAVRLDVTYDDAWALENLTVTASGQSLDAPLAHHVRMELPDGWAGQPINVVVWGNKDGQHFAGGSVTVTPVLKQEISAQVALSRVPCGAWCTAGAMECQGNNTVVCTANDRGCTDWASPTACLSSTPYCSFGTCSATCVDECAMGEQRCEGPSALRNCGQGDADSCLDWLPALPCAQGQVCSNGACVAVCQNECTAGEIQCLGAGTITCGDLDHNGCTEWGPVVPCANGTSCSNGACSASCTDDCTASMCSGSTFQMCGQFDLDSCKDLSPGVSCVPSDPCMQGSCTPTGCQATPKLCNTPPASTCKDASTLTVYDSSGSCAAGTCSYAPHDLSCPNCPSCDACAGITCNTPPSSCYQATGTCSAGSCSYAFNDGASCSDNNSCTTGDTCKSGVCSGVQIVCTTPPAPACTSSTSLRSYSSPGSCGTSGTCSYPYTDMSCACANGTCATASGWSTGPSLPAGRYGLAAAAEWAGFDNRIYALGGLDLNIDPVSTLYMYTPSTKKWVQLADMPTARSYLAAAVGTDGRIYAIGGDDATQQLKTVEVYTPSSNSWASVASLTTARSGLGAAAGFDGRIYAIGGYDGTTNLKSAEVYDPGSNSWSPMTSMPTARNTLATAVGLDGTIYAIAGYDGSSNLNTVESYLPGTTGKWSTLSVLPTARSALAAAVLANGSLFAMGGLFSYALSTVEVYTPSAGSWAKGPSLPTPRSELAAVTGTDGRIYAIGGVNGTGTTQVLSTMEIYTP